MVNLKDKHHILVFIKDIPFYHVSILWLTQKRKLLDLSLKRSFLWGLKKYHGTANKFFLTHSDPFLNISMLLHAMIDMH